METIISPQHSPQYLAEKNTLLHQRISITVLLGALLFPLFSILDFVVAREFFALYLSNYLFNGPDLYLFL